ncbi:MAG: 50S ribosomal protein L23 [Gammaproteobacteria bacterium]|nr:50S ribosomal protein L23 [Gammaproteobacteria bacterium]MDH4315430.1 50S ribosomal protein L23 [Gammaproteobacteria bacterium]MDH5212676.1 50S ribosomal protein L23 [Gammaproteobacteria bacterium]
MSTNAHQERLLTVIYGPHLSEKAHNASARNQVVFKVRTDATKKDVKQAVEMLFEVKVDGVTVANYDGKVKRHGATRGRRVAWKKAYVRLAEGSQIDFLGGE